MPAYTDTPAVVSMTDMINVTIRLPKRASAADPITTAVVKRPARMVKPAMVEDAMIVKPIKVRKGREDARRNVVRKLVERG